MNDPIIAELEKLWKAGAVDLPQAATAFAEGAQEIHKTGLNESGAFSRSSGGMGGLHPEWTKLRNTMQNRILVKTHQNLIKSGTALTHLADAFAAEDTDNKTKLDQYKEEIENGPVQEQPPSYIPEAPKSTDDHPEEGPHGSGPN